MVVAYFSRHLLLFPPFLPTVYQPFCKIPVMSVKCLVVCDCVCKYVFAYFR